MRTWTLTGERLTDFLSTLGVPASSDLFVGMWQLTIGDDEGDLKAKVNNYVWSLPLASVDGWSNSNIAPFERAPIVHAAGPYGVQAFANVPPAGAFTPAELDTLERIERTPAADLHADAAE